jgi:sec-independent protein translocase protein TatA
MEVCTMGGLSIWHWLIVGGVALLLFGGKGKISDIMGDVAKGIKSFKKGLLEDDAKADAPQAGEAAVRSIDHQSIADPAKVSDPRKVG